MKILGVDPGKSGAIALLDSETKKLEYSKYPLLPNDEIDHKALYELVTQYNPDWIFMEKVHSVYGSSAKSNFSFGKSVGITETICFLIQKPVEMVTPKKWQNVVWSGIIKVKDAKKNSLTAVKSIFPSYNFLATERSRVPHDGLVDAALIAYYGMLKIIGK